MYKLDIVLQVDWRYDLYTLYNACSDKCPMFSWWMQELLNIKLLPNYNPCCLCLCPSHFSGCGLRVEKSFSLDEFFIAPLFTLVSGSGLLPSQVWQCYSLVTSDGAGLEIELSRELRKFSQCSFFNVKSFRCCLLTCVSCWLYLLQILFLLLPPISPNVGGSSSLQSLSARGNFRTKVTMNGIVALHEQRRGCHLLRPYSFSCHLSSQLFSMWCYSIKYLSSLPSSTISLFAVKMFLHYTWLYFACKHCKVFEFC